MKKLLVIVHLVSSFLLMANDAALTPPPDRPISLSKSKVLLKRTGGFLTRRLPGASFVFADLRIVPSFPEDEIKAIQESCQIPVERQVIKDRNKSPIQVATELLQNTQKVGGVAVLFNGAANQPVLTVFPENRITLINVTPLADKVSQQVYQDRLIKEMWRAISYTAGGTSSSTPYCVMQTILQPSDLDTLKCSMANPEVTGQISNNAKRFGFGTIITSTYRSACKEGWAPAPTNEYQRAIWERVKSDKERGPTNGIKIEPVRR